MLVRPDTIIYFYFTKNVYIYNLYSILKISEHDVLLVRQFHPVSLTFFYQSMDLNPHLSHYFFLTFYVDLIKWAVRPNGLARHSQQAGMTCLSQSCGPRVSGPCRAAFWPSIGVHQVNLK
jgi:hypothetical protein